MPGFDNTMKFGAYVISHTNISISVIVVDSILISWCPSKLLVHLKPQNVTLFGKKVFADIIR